MADKSLKYRAKKGLIWSAVERFSTQGIQLIFSVILARLLSPSDYGIIAMPMIFLMIAQVFIDSGFANALIRKPDLTEKDLSTAFYFNILVGITCYLVLFISAPIIADFYETPILKDVLKVTALSTLFNPLCTVQQAILTKRIDFKTQANISVWCSLIGGIVGVYLAYTGYGVWALAFSQVVNSLLRIILLWTSTKWYPHTGWSMDSFHYLWNYGSKLLASGLLDTTYQNLYPLIIGKFYSAASLGYYTRAQHFAQMPSLTLSGILRRVTFPVLSELQDDDEKLGKGFERILRMTIFIIFPSMFIMIGSAKPLILFLLGEKWIDAVPFLQILSFALMWIPIDALNLNLLTIKGRTGLFLKLEILKKLIGIVLLIATIKMGLIWITCGYALYCFIEIITDSYYSGKFYNIGFFKQIRMMLPSLFLCLVIFFGTLCVNEVISVPIIALVIDLILSVLIILLISYLLKYKELNEVMTFIKQKN